MIFSVLSDWVTTLSLIFGGCCSNAVTLEQLTSQYPNAGSLITLFQFLVVSLFGLPKHITWTPYGPRFKPRRIPLTTYLVQVALFYLISLLNNAAFGYQIPMAVHIIFRSGGLIISMVLGWLISGKRYTVIQVLSVLVVTAGVILTTLSAAKPPTKTMSGEKATDTDLRTYSTGIAILTLALIFSGFLGLVQDWTYSKYGRPIPSSAKAEKTVKDAGGSDTQSPPWQEAMFYLHFLALPMFLPLLPDLSLRLEAINAGPRTRVNLPDIIPGGMSLHPLVFSFPTAYMPLVLNTLTQLLCVAGVNRLTTRVSALTVTLVLVVRKAVSLVLSVVAVSGGVSVDQKMMWGGAGMVLAGTVGYSIGTGSKPKLEKQKKS